LQSKEEKRRMLRKVDHIGIVVENLEKALALYKTLYGLDPLRIEVMEELNLTMAFIPLGEVLIELLEPKEPGKGRIGQFLKEKGEGFDHIAYEVEDIDTLMENLKQAHIGLRDQTPRKGAGGSRIAFIDPAYTNNVLTELVEQNRESEEKNDER
jgi:methylmalonyl-CoA/ethylmalonyl-CoA epimerase